MSKKILLVEDDLKFRRFVVSILEQRGYTIVQAVTVQEALVELANGRFDLMIVDGSLPDASGLELIKRMQISRHGIGMPIVYISAFAHQTEYFCQLTAERSLELILHKPISPTVFAAQIGKVLDDQRNFETEFEVDDILAALTKEYGEGLPSLVKPILDNAHKFVQADQGIAAFNAILQDVHKVKGTAGSYGFHSVSEILSVMEQRLHELHNHEHMRWQPAFVQGLNDLLMQLSHISEQARFHLPAVERSTGATRAVCSGSRRVMLFDDDHTFCRRVEALLTAENFLVYSFTDAIRFKETIEQIRPDLLLLDVALGGSVDSEGLNLCREVRANKSWDGLGVVFLTGSENPGLRKEAMSLGANCYLTKPINNAELLRVVRSYCGSTGLSRYDLANADASASKTSVPPKTLPVMETAAAEPSANSPRQGAVRIR